MDAELPLDGALDPQEKLKTKSHRILLDARATLLVCFRICFSSPLRTFRAGACRTSSAMLELFMLQRPFWEKQNSPRGLFLMLIPGCPWQVHHVSPTRLHLFRHKKSAHVDWKRWILKKKKKEKKIPLFLVGFPLMATAGICTNVQSKMSYISYI